MEKLNTLTSRLFERLCWLTKLLLLPGLLLLLQALLLVVVVPPVVPPVLPLVFEVLLLQMTMRPPPLVGPTTSRPC